MSRARADQGLAVALLCAAPLLSGASATAAPSESTVVAPVPASTTPNVADGAVLAVASVGGTTVVGGTFTATETVAATGSAPAQTTPTPYVLAFDTASGALRTAFAPRLDGTVQALLPGPTTDTVYAAGLFRNAGGAAVSGLVLLRLSDGSRVTTFRPPVLDLANVQTVKRSGSRLFVGGGFARANGVAHGGILALDATTGAVDPYLVSSATGNHSWRPTSPSTDAKAPVGVYKLDITPDGSTMVTIGNFTSVDGTPRDQIALWDLTGYRAALRPWRTTRLVPACNTAAFDQYVRDVDLSPDGTWFVLADTGGYGPAGSLCDSASRWEVGATAADVQPTWVAYTGKDTLLSTAVTGTAVYVGGHQRWLNNPLGVDSAAPGSVPRPGVAALDPANGLPLAWDPGRHPRGIGTSVLYVDPSGSGLWMGSDTTWVGNYRYRRGRIALFPLAGGTAPAARTVAQLPGTVWTGTAPAAGTPGALWRVDAGGPTLAAVDGGPPWTGDTGSRSTLRTSGSTTTAYVTPVLTLDGTVPAGVPRAVFSSERTEPGAVGDGQEMQWHFPVTVGQQVDVRLLLAYRLPVGTGGVGARTFDVVLDGTTRTTGLDVAAAVGRGTGTMRSWTVTSDGRVDLTLVHRTGDPVVSGIEVVPTGSDSPAAPPGAFSTRSFDGTTAGPAVPVSTPLDPATVRGATVVGGTLFYGRTDGQLYRRSLSGTTFGPEAAADPYEDPAWATVQTGSGGTSDVYRGVKPGFYDEISNLTSLFYDGAGRLCYTQYLQNALRCRAFSPDSGTVAQDEVQLPVVLPPVTGAFVSGRDLYYVPRSTGDLVRVGFDGTSLVGTPTVVDGPSASGTDWRSGVLFLAPKAG